MSARLSKPRVTPCATCPYRLNVPAGVWAPEEYVKLIDYDRPTPQQPMQAFACHQQDGAICSGWLAHAEPTELLAVRIGIITGGLDPSCATYTTDVPLHESGRAAAEHGLAGVDEPDENAQDAVRKLMQQQALREEGKQ